MEKNNPTTVTIEGKPYNYDYISGAETTQEDIFHIVGKPVALAWLEGRNRERLRKKVDHSLHYFSKKHTLLIIYFLFLRFIGYNACIFAYG